MDKCNSFKVIVLRISIRMALKVKNSIKFLTEIFVWLTLSFSFKLE